MKIVHVLTSDQGGAAKACIRLHYGLLAKGIDSKILVLESHSDDIMELYTYIQYKVGIHTRILNKIKFEIEAILNLNKYSKLSKDVLLSGKVEGYEIFSFPTSFYNLLNQPIIKAADIIHLHWVAGFIDYPSFLKKTKKTIAWTLHDQNPFTGGCHYSDGCKLYESNCSICPQLKGTLIPSLSEHLLEIKEKSFTHCTKLTIIAPSRWIFNKSRASRILGKFRHIHLPNGINIAEYAPKDKLLSRYQLGIPAESKVLLFVSHSLSNRRKGLNLLKQAIEGIESLTNLVLCAAGATDIPPWDSFEIVQLGWINNSDEMVRAISAADVFIVPSLEDNLPNTIIESICCGLPVIGFPVGGIPELIEHCINGYLCEDTTVESLRSAIIYFFDHLSLFNREEIRNRAILNFKIESIVDSYLEQITKDIT